MRKIIKFAIREYKTAVKTKGFIIGLILAPVLMSGGFIALILLKDRVDTNDKHMVIIDHSNLVAEELIRRAEDYNLNSIYDKETSEKIKPAYHFKIMASDKSNPQKQLLELSDRVRNNELHAFLVIGKDVIHPGEDGPGKSIYYYGKNAAMDDLRNWITWPVNDQLRKVRLSDAGIEETQVKDLFTWIDIEGMGLVTLDQSTGDISEARRASPVEALAVPIGIMMIMFLMIMMSVPGMLHSVMEEKTQRIAEVLLGSIKPFEFMAAKLLGGIAVSLTSSAVYIVGGVIAVTSMGFENYIPYHVLPWFFVFMLLAILMFGAYSAAMGATCSEAKDAQSLTFPTILPALIPMFIYFPIAKEPLSNFATWMSLIPPLTPLLMVLRLGTPESIPIWQPIVGLIGVILFTLFIIWAGGRIFRVAILMQGTPPKFANIIRWTFRG